MIIRTVRSFVTLSRRVLDNLEVATRPPARRTPTSTPASTVLVEGKIRVSSDDHADDPPYALRLERKGPGDVVLVLEVGRQVYARVPYDNLIKMQVRLDPDHATRTERQVADARKAMGEAQAKMYDETARVEQLRQQLDARERRIEELETQLHRWAAATQRETK
jgi:hypothetical protein